MSLKTALRVGFKDVADKVGGLAKDLTGSVTGDQSRRDEGRAQLDQAHVEPETAAVEAEEGRGHQQDGVLRRVRKL